RREDTPFISFYQNLLITTFAALGFVMPLHLDSSQLKHGQRLVVWKTTESTRELIDLAKLNEGELGELKSIHLEKRQREWLDTRILLNTFFPEKELDYLANGKPVFK